MRSVINTGQNSLNVSMFSVDNGFSEFLSRFLHCLPIFPFCLCHIVYTLDLPLTVHCCSCQYAAGDGTGGVLFFCFSFIVRKAWHFVPPSQRWGLLSDSFLSDGFSPLCISAPSPELEIWFQFLSPTYIIFMLKVLMFSPLAERLEIVAPQERRMRRIQACSSPQPDTDFLSSLSLSMAVVSSEVCEV